MSKYNIKELKEKLERCRNINLEDVTLNDVDDLANIKINGTIKKLFKQFIKI